MTATADQIEAALLAPWLSVSDGGTGEWVATPYENIGWDNVTLDPAALADQSGWMEVSTSAGTRRKIGAGDVYASYPTVLVSAHTPIGTGKQRARQLIDAAAALYRERIFTVGPSKLWAYSFSQPMELPRDGWFKLSMQISFRIQ